MDIDVFLRERRPAWLRLENLLAAAERSPEWELGHRRIRELVTLYREACSDLNRARAMTANPEILDRLNQLTGRAYRFVYRGTRRDRATTSLKTFLLKRIPATFQAERVYVIAAAGAFLLGAAFGLAAVLMNPAHAEDLIPAQFFTESPRERVLRIEEGGERIDSMDKALVFGASLYTHNIQVTFLAFSLGAISILGGLFILFYNGVILGAVAGMYWLEGVEVFFLAWVGPHGALELPAIVFGGAAGLRMGRALLLPGDLTREASLRAAFPTVWRIMIMAALTLVLAGLIEGSFSQFSAKTAPYALKISIAIVLFVTLLIFLYLKRDSKAELAVDAER